jgi:hypothetical protein
MQDATAQTSSNPTGTQLRACDLKAMFEGRLDCQPPFINTLLQRGGRVRAGRVNRFSGFYTTWETAEAVQCLRGPMNTPLKHMGVRIAV